MYRPMISILAAAFVTGLLAGNPAWAGYKEGVAAYKAKNYELALKEFRKAADRGHAGAQHRLGFMYEKGRGVRTNEETARKWYRLSAEQGNARGQRGLGRLLRKGRGGPRDLVEAYKWSTLALEKRPNEKLEHWRGWIEKRLTWDEIAEAKKRAKEWRERHSIQTETLPPLVMTSGAYGFDLEKECGDFARLRSPDSKIYRGEYEGTGHPPREAVLAVIETTGTNRVFLIYAGIGRRGSFCHPLIGSIEGQTLTARTPWRGVTLTYTFDGEGGVTQSFQRTRNGTVEYESEGKLQLAK